MLIDIARDFSDTPAGRFRADGPFSGEEFRERILLPPIVNNEEVVVNMDGVEGLGSSFLEEAFGGLVRLGYFTQNDLKRRLIIRTDDETILEEIWDYIETARRN